ncbi:MAG: hypothetical protein V1859_06940 [archaeon]
MDPIKFLADVPKENAFWTGNGNCLNNLDELLIHLKKEGVPFFSHHVTENKNDFANWIHYVVGDVELSQSMFATKDFLETVALVEKRIETLKEDSFNNEIFDSISQVFEGDKNSVLMNSLDASLVMPSQEFENKFDHSKIIDIIEKSRISHDEKPSSVNEETQAVKEIEVFTNATTALVAEPEISSDIADEELKLYKQKLDVAFERLSSNLKPDSAPPVYSNARDAYSPFSNLTFDIGFGKFFESIKKKIRKY